MKVTFLGGAKTVTGSCYLIEANSKKILVDCGMFQGNSQEFMLNSAPFDFEPEEIECVLLTHAHIDHSGRIPKLCKEGFRGQIITTEATVQLCSIMLPDAGHIQEIENEWINRKRRRAGKDPVEPLYTVEDATDSLRFFSGVRYSEIINLVGNITVRFNDAGHMLGSSIIEIWVNEDGVETKLVFTGDLGNNALPLLKEPSIIENADYLFIESTYGNRFHHDSENKADKFMKIINETIEKGGNVIVPSFAVGRTQEIIYELHNEKEKYTNELAKFYKIPVYIDSPLAISATEVFRNNLDCCHEKARNYIENGENPLDFPGLQFTRTAEESKELNEKEESMIIVSASGMCEAGRIKHHLKHNIWRPESTILFVGYQAPGTLGRRIVDGAEKIKIYGEEISVNARVEMIDGFSGHADQIGLLDWVSNFKEKPNKVFIVHGEDEAQVVLSEKIEEKFNYDTIIPDKGDTYVITKDKCDKYAESVNTKYRFERLSVLLEIDNLRSELDELMKTYKKYLKDDSVDDDEINQVGSRLHQLKEQIDKLKSK